MKIGILTGGGDCPGLNAVIRAVVAKAEANGFEVLGIQGGWKGLLERETRPLNYAEAEEIFALGGTILGTSRTNPRKIDNGVATCINNFKALALDALIAIGGEDTLGFAAHLASEGLPMIGVPKTIDNDLLGTDFTFGFDTAVSIATDAIDRLRTTAKSHNRTMVLELMGRHAGWIATFAGIAGGADVVITPEHSMTVDEITAILKQQRQRGKGYNIVVVAEGAEIKGLGNVASEETDAFGHKRLGGIGEQLANAIKEKTALDTRATSLGHIQRGGSPTASDRILSTRYGLFAMELVLKQDFGKMAVLRGNNIEAESLQRVREGIKTVPDEFYAIAKQFFC